MRREEARCFWDLDLDLDTKEGLAIDEADDENGRHSR